MSQEIPDAPQEQKLADDSEKVSKEFVEDLKVALSPLHSKYAGKVNELAIMINWAQEYVEKPYPKFVVQTLRKQEDADHVRQVLEICALADLSRAHVSHQLINGLLQEIDMLRKHLSGQQTADPAK